MAPLLLAWLAAGSLRDEDVTSLVQVKIQPVDDDHVVSLYRTASEPASEADGRYYWSGKNGDNLRTGGVDFPMPVDLKAGPAWSWHEGRNGLIRVAPLIDAKKNIYLATIAGNVYKFSPDGEVLWKHKEGVQIPEVPAIMGGALYATNTRGEVFALNMSTGKRLWKKKAGKASAGDTWSMTAADGMVIAALSSNGGVANDYISALDAKDGSVRWSFKPQVPVYNSLSAVRGSNLVLSDLNGRPYRLNLADGSLIWKSEPGLGVVEEPSFSTGGAVIGPNGLVYVTSNSKKDGVERGHVTAFQFSDGKMLWRQGTDYQANNAPAVGRLGADGPLAVVVGVGPNPDMPDPIMQLTKTAPTSEKRARVMALDAATGRVIWRHELPKWHGWAAGDSLSHVCLPDSFGNPAISGDGTVFVGFQSGRFYGINDRNHDGNVNTSEVTSYNFSNAFQGSPGLAPGMLVATPCNGLHVFRAKSS